MFPSIIFLSWKSEVRDTSVIPDEQLDSEVTAERLHRAHKAITAGFTELGGNFLLKLGMVVQTVVIARLYAPHELGSLATALLVIGATTSITSLGLDRYLLSIGDDDLQSQLDVAFTLSLVAGGIGVLLLLLAASWVDLLFGDALAPAHVRILSPMALGTALLIPLVMWERQLRYAWAKVPVLLGMAVFTGVAVAARMLWEWGVGGLFLAQIASFATTGFAVWTLAPARPRLRWNRWLVERQLRFGFPLLLAGIATFLAGQGDDLLVRYFTGNEGLGLYVVAFYLPSYLLAVVDILARVSLPFLAPLRESIPHLKHAFRTISGYIAAVSVGLGGILWLFADELVRMIYGAQWITIVPLVQIFSIAFILRAVTGYHWQSLAVLFGRTRYLMWTSVATAAFMFVFAPALIWKFGLWGGAFYSLLQLGIMAPLVRFPLIRETLGDLSYLTASGPAVIAGACAVLIAFMIQELAAIAIPEAWALGAYLLTYCGLLMALDRSVYAAVAVMIAGRSGRN